MMSSSIPYFCPSNKFISGFNSYVFDIISIPDRSIIASSCSDHSIKLYDSERYQLINTFLGHENTIYDLQYCDKTSNMLYSCSSDKTIKFWDINSNKNIHSINESNEIYSCSININGNALVAGTGSHITIWDLRKIDKPLIKYQDCHSQIVTQVRFNPNNNNDFCSGSEDGLICNFDISQSNEDDALQSIIPINHCINKLGYINNNIYSCTSTEQFSIWNLETTECIKHFGDIREHRMPEGQNNDYIIDCHYNSNLNEINLYIGSYQGDIVILQVQPNDLLHKAILHKGHNNVVRSITNISNNDNMLLSGGEDGRVCQWKLIPQEENEEEEEDNDLLMDIDNISNKYKRNNINREKYKYILNPYQRK